MEWEDKGKMVALFNQSKSSEGVRFVFQNLKKMDIQAWDMFFNGVYMLREQFVQDITFHTTIYNVVKGIKDVEGFRSQTRHQIYLNLVEEILICLNKRLTVEYLFANGFGVGSNTIYESVFINYEGFCIKLYLENESFWWYECGDKKFEVNSVDRLRFLIEYVTGKKWNL